MPWLTILLLAFVALLALSFAEGAAEGAGSSLGARRRLRVAVVGCSVVGLAAAVMHLVTT